jgi:hypothetical protein
MMYTTIRSLFGASGTNGTHFDTRPALTNVKIVHLEYYIELECEECGTIYRRSGRGDLPDDIWHCPNGCSAPEHL